MGVVITICDDDARANHPSDVQQQKTNGPEGRESVSEEPNGNNRKPEVCGVTTDPGSKIPLRARLFRTASANSTLLVKSL